MTAWHRQHLPASWRGVPFVVAAATRAGGRQLITWEADGVDAPDYDDRRARTPAFTLEAFVFGDDVLARRNALEAALDAPGPGVLVHPTRGTLLCRIGAVETTEDGGSVVRFSIEVRPIRTLPERVSLDIEAVVAGHRDSLLTAAFDAFAALWDVASAVAYVSAGARDVLTVTGAIRRAVTAPAAFVRATAATTLDRLARLESDVEAIVRSPEDLARALGDAVAGLQSWAALSFLGPLLGAEAWQAAAGPTVDQTEAANRRALERFVARTVVAHAALAACTEAWATADAALEAEQVLARALADLAGDADHASLAAQLALQAATLTHLHHTAAALPRLVVHRVDVPTPALVLAHALYGDAARVSGLLTVAQLADPSMVLAEPIRVLSA